MSIVHPEPTIVPPKAAGPVRRINRLSAFHGETDEENSHKLGPVVTVEVKTDGDGSTSSSSPQSKKSREKAIEESAKPIDVKLADEEEKNEKATESSTALTPLAGENGKKTSGGGVSPPRGAKETAKSSDGSISVRLSTMWENMKRMMGFSPDCHNGGYRSIGSRSCTCPQYFEGQFCERILCINGGSRVRVAAFGTEEVCKCPHPEYIGGKHCEQVNCQNGGRLINDGPDGIASCHCVDGWYSGQFCQYYTSSWLLAIGLPLLFISLVIFCCVLCRMDLCAHRRHPPPRNRHADRRPNGRRRQHQNCGENRQGNHRHRREQVPFRQTMGDDGMAPPHPHQQHNLYIQQNLLNGHQQQSQQSQYVLRLEQIPMYNPRLLYLPMADKPLEPPPPYEQAVLGLPPDYCQLPPQQPTTDTLGEPPEGGGENRTAEEGRTRRNGEGGEGDYGEHGGSTGEGGGNHNVNHSSSAER